MHVIKYCKSMAKILLMITLKLKKNNAVKQLNKFGDQDQN